MKKVYSRILVYFVCSLLIYLLMYFQAKPLAQYFWNWRFNEVSNEEYMYIIYLLPLLLEAIAFFIVTIDASKDFIFIFVNEIKIFTYLKWIFGWIGVMLGIITSYLFQIFIRSFIYFENKNLVWKLNVNEAYFWNNQQYWTMLRQEIFGQLTFLLLFILVLLCIHWLLFFIHFRKNLKITVIFILTFLMVQTYVSLLYVLKLLLNEWISMGILFFLFATIFLLLLRGKVKIDSENKLI